MAYVRTVKTSSGATAVQVVWSWRKGSRSIEHIGSAHDNVALAALKTAAAERLAAGQTELDLGLSGGVEAGTLPIMSSQMTHLWEGLCAAYRILGFESATKGDSVFRDLVLARIIEPTSKIDAERVLSEVGVDALRSGSKPVVRNRTHGRASSVPCRRTPRYGAEVMRRRHATMAVALLILVSACGNDSTSSPSSATATTNTAGTEAAHDIDAGTAQRLDAAIDQVMTAASIPGAIIGIWGPEGRYVRAVGVADKATGAPMKTDVYSRIGSMTKTFTVTAILQLAEQGKIGLEDPMGKYIDGVPNGDKIALRELARMRSGLENYANTTEFQQALVADPYRNFTPQELLGYAFAAPPVFPPGQGFQYSNTNTVLLGLVVEKVGGQKLPDYTRVHILVPLGMDHTSFPTTNAFPEPHAQGYTTTTASGAETTATDWNPSWAWAAGAMISTLQDMHIWAPALATGKLLAPEIQKQRLQTLSIPGQPPRDGYGLGIFNLGGWIGHNGSVPGYEAVAVYLPEKQLTLVILINTDIAHQGGEPSSTLATAITKVITPEHVYTVGRS